jgi:integrase
MSVHKVVNTDGSVSWKARTKDLNRRSMQATFPTEREAKRWDREQAERKDRGVQPRPGGGRLTFSAWAQQYLAARQLSRRAATLRVIDKNIRLHYAPAFGNRRLSAITPTHVQEWVNDMARVYAPATVRQSYKFLRAIFNAAVAARELAESPCGKHVQLPTMPLVRRDALSVEQVEAIIDALPARYSTVALLAARTGMRQGECLGLRWTHVDVDAGTIFVDRQLTYPQGGPVLSDVKTPTSRRLLYVERAVIDALVAHRERYGTGAVTDTVDGRVVDDLVFASTVAGPMHHRTWQDNWTQVQSAVGLERGEGMHQLRHFAGSAMMRSGVMSLVEIRDALGHASLNELDRYCHTFADRRDGMRAAMAATFGTEVVRPLRSAS